MTCSVFKATWGLQFWGSIFLPQHGRRVPLFPCKKEDAVSLLRVLIRGSQQGGLSQSAAAGFVRIHATLGFCLFSFPPESQPWAWETWLNVSLFERKIPQVSQQDTVESKPAERKPAKPCLKVVLRQSILRFCGLKGRCSFIYFFVSHRIWSWHESSSRQRGVKN